MDWRGLETFSFGDSPEMANELAALVLEGRKRATCWAASEGEQTGIGKCMVMLDGSGRPRAVVETLELILRRFDEVDAAFAYDEGEDDRTLASWRKTHRDFFERGGVFAEDMLLWCERFRIVERIEETKSALDIQAISTMDRERFTVTLGPVFEHSPWIAERAWAARPFESLAALHAAMVSAIRAASPAERLALIRAHPDLAGKAARAGALTAESQSEQGGAGLDQLTEAEFARFERLNRTYRERFGLPFVIAVRGRGKAEILDAFERRLANDAAAETETALDQVAEIGRLRLQRMLSEPGTA